MFRIHGDRFLSCSFWVLSLDCQPLRAGATFCVPLNCLAMVGTQLIFVNKEMNYRIEIHHSVVGHSGWNAVSPIGSPVPR